MPERRPAEGPALQQFYNRIAPIIEAPDGRAAQLAVHAWNPTLFKHMRSEAEMRMLMFGQGASDRYLYGLCSAVVAMKEENGGVLPPLSDAQYELDRETGDYHRASQDPARVAYFAELALVFEERLPLTTMLRRVIEHDLRTRLQVPEIDMEDGFTPGWYKAVRVAAPLFKE